MLVSELDVAAWDSATSWGASSRGVGLVGSRGSGPPSGPRGPSRPRPPSEGVTCAHRRLRAFGRSLRLRPPGRESSSLLAPTAGQDPPFPWSAHPITAGGCGRDGGGERRGGQCQGLPEGPQDPAGWTHQADACGASLHLSCHLCGARGSCSVTWLRVRRGVREGLLLVLSPKARSTGGTGDGAGASGSV